MVRLIHRHGGRLDRIRLPYFYHLSHYLGGLAFLRQDTPIEQRGTMVWPAVNALQELHADQEIGLKFPRLKQVADWLFPSVQALAEGKLTPSGVDLLQQQLTAATVAINEELERVYAYRLSDKGGLSVQGLVEGASSGFPADVLQYLDETVIFEIDEAGRCLACALYTACGFHIFRSVDIVIKAYVHAETGTLPKQRNWGEYISQLKQANASSTVTDMLHILKGKRNPLMHPQDTLDEADAVDIFCLCRAAIGTLISDTLSRRMEDKFVASLTAMSEMR